MKSIRIESKELSESVVRALRDKDAALWVGPNHGQGPAAAAVLRQLIGLPWKIVLCEYGSIELLRALQSAAPEQDDFSRERGFIHVIASDPEGIDLPPRSLPVLFLNGRQDSKDPNELPSLGSFARVRRRLNMLHLLVAKRPKMLVVLGDGSDQPLEDLQTLWNEEGFRALLTVVSTSPRDQERIDKWLSLPNAPTAVDFCSEELLLASATLRDRLRKAIPEDRVFIRLKSPVGGVVDYDITDCDLLERPILDKFELLQTRDLRLLQAHELSRDELESFFSRSMRSWRPFAAGLPWSRSPSAASSLLKELAHVAQTEPGENKILSIVTEAGAGGTTFARMLAFAVASEGFPVLLARPGANEFSALELSRFLFAVTVATRRESQPGVSTDVSSMVDLPEVPWLIVFDVEHWEGRETELRMFLGALRNDGRPALILRVSPPSIAADFGKSTQSRQLVYLTHELALEEVLKLGDHLNKFLKVHGREHSAHEWQAFWEAHRPDYLQRTSAHFWISLEFWLRGLINLSQSIQKWLYDSFQKASITDDLRLIVLEIAALSVERQPLPEGLIPLSKEHKLPYSLLLEQLRNEAPAIALVRENIGENRLWAIAHDLLARYLLTSTFLDRALLDRLGLSAASDPVALRLILLRRVATRTDLALKPFRRLGVDFAVKILKLDADGNQEFILHWREVLEILKSIPPGVRQASRAFNHHVAVSLRRVAKQREFGVTPPERREILSQAVGHLEYALTELDDAGADESKLNLFNSLALAYQDLADTEVELGAAPAAIEGLRKKASDATHHALEQDPFNPYVLETTAKNLIQQGELYAASALGCATEALSYIYQALTLERSENRQYELTRLADRAIKLLRSAGDIDRVRQLAAQGNPLGVLAEAWMTLLTNVDDSGGASEFSAMPAANVLTALSVLESSPLKSDWLLIRLRYDLQSIAHPTEFEQQLRLLDELEGTSYRMPLQLQLEHAILLHQQNRHFEANKKFRLLRQQLKRTDAFVEVPNRLFWLKSMADRTRTVCEAQVVELRGHRAVAKVRELLNEMVPFVPQEFGLRDMRPGMKFKCWINFGRLGPFLKPPTKAGQS